MFDGLLGAVYEITELEIGRLWDTNDSCAFDEVGDHRDDGAYTLEYMKQWIEAQYYA